MKFRRGKLLAGALIGVGAMVLSAIPAGATSGTAAISAGTFSFVSSPSTVAFTATLNGHDQTAPATQTFDIGDATGSGTGWNITATSTTFTAGAHSLSTGATTVGTGPTVACDASTTCTTATNSITYPYTLPAASPIAPTATKLYNAAANTGMGNQTVTANFTLALPANTYAGSYTSTWTYSLVSAP